MQTIKDQTFDEERALYGSEQVEAVNCRFDGPADGESAFKESSEIIARDCYFNHHSLQLEGKAQETSFSMLLKDVYSICQQKQMHIFRASRYICRCQGCFVCIQKSAFLYLDHSTEH